MPNRRKNKVLKPIRPNIGLEKQFQRDLERIIDAMHKSVDYWIVQAYKRDQLANDASPAARLADLVGALSKRWQQKFNEGAKPMADYYANKAKDHTDTSLRNALKLAGFTIYFTMTDDMHNVVTAAVESTVSLIKSISSEHFSDIRQMVMRSVQEGRDLYGLRKELQNRYVITRKRAALIARAYNNQVSASIERQRASDLGLHKALWQHTPGSSLHPRKEHLDWNGKEFDTQQGMWSTKDGKYVFPGMPINCKCVQRMILPFVTENKKRDYDMARW